MRKQTQDGYYCTSRLISRSSIQLIVHLCPLHVALQGFHRPTCRLFLRHRTHGLDCVHEP